MAQIRCAKLARTDERLRSDRGHDEAPAQSIGVRMADREIERVALAGYVSLGKPRELDTSGAGVSPRVRMTRETPRLRCGGLARGNSSKPGWQIARMSVCGAGVESDHNENPAKARAHVGTFNQDRKRPTRWGIDRASRWH